MRASGKSNAQCEKGSEMSEEMRAWIEDQPWPGHLRRYFLKLIDTATVTEAWCPTCNGSTKVRYPDYNGLAKLVKMLKEYKERP